MRRLSLLVGAVLICAACSAPPQKEIDTAQGAIDGARSAGAEEYATEALNAATSALRAAHDAVAQGDYRLALSRALDARERAQQAAKLAADGRARRHSETDAVLRDVDAALVTLDEQLSEAEDAGVPPRALEQPRDTARTVRASLQKARAAMMEGNYRQATAAAAAGRDDIAVAMKAVDREIESRPARPQRRRGTRS